MAVRQASKIAVRLAAAPARPTLMRAGAPRAFGVIASTMEKLVADLPYKEVLQYPIQANMKWSIADTHKMGTALANGLLEMSISPGDAIAVQMPDCAELHCAQFAAAYGGYTLVTIKPDAGASDIHAALAASGARVFFHCGLDEDRPALDEAVPEAATYSTMAGTPLIVKTLPRLKYLVSLNSMDRHKPSLNFQHIMCYHPTPDPIPAIAAAVDDSTPLAIDGVGKALTHKQVLESGAWPALSSVLNKGHYVCEGPHPYFPYIERKQFQAHSAN